MRRAASGRVSGMVRARAQQGTSSLGLLVCTHGVGARDSVAMNKSWCKSKTQEYGALAEVADVAQVAEVVHLWASPPSSPACSPASRRRRSRAPASWKRLSRCVCAQQIFSPCLQVCDGECKWKSKAVGWRRPVSATHVDTFTFAQLDRHVTFSCFHAHVFTFSRVEFWVNVSRLSPPAIDRPTEEP